jgi:outer membrane protein assembly factor BamB
MTRKLAVVLCSAALVPLAAGHALASTALAGSSFHVDVTHDGNASGTGFQAPVEQRWSRSWHGTVSYPLIADGRVYVSVSFLHDTSDRKILALDAATGETLWRRDAIAGYGVFGIAYDAGRLLSVNSDGLLSALDGETGDLDWSAQLPGQYLFTSPPTASGGVVYVGGSGSGGTVYTVDASTGDVLWTQSVANGDHSAPTVTPRGIVVGYACFHVYELSTTDGSVVWHHDTNCSGGGGRTTAYFGARVYARDNGDGVILRDAHGGQVGTFTSSAIPAFSGTHGYFLENGTLRARDLSTHTAEWSFAADGTLVSEPLVIDGRIFIASSSGSLYALWKRTGKVIRTFPLGASFLAPDEHNAVPLTGMNAGGGLLVVPASDHLVAFG